MLLISLSGAWIAGILLGTKLSLAPVWLAVSALPLPFIFLEIIIGIIQALIFAMLTLVFLTVMTSSHDGEEGEAAAGH